MSISQGQWQSRWLLSHGPNGHRSLTSTLSMLSVLLHIYIQRGQSLVILSVPGSFRMMVCREGHGAQTPCQRLESNTRGSLPTLRPLLQGVSTGIELRRTLLLQRAGGYRTRLLMKGLHTGARMRGHTEHRALFLCVLCRQKARGCLIFSNRLSA